MNVARNFVITNRLGMHARAASNFVMTAKGFAAEIEVEKNGKSANGKTIIDLLLLVAAKGSVVTVRGRGADAEKAVLTLGRLIEGGFDLGN